MNSVSLPCSQCAREIAVTPDAEGRAIACPYCQSATVVPSLAVAARSLVPDFTETLRRAHEATDSIFNDQDDDGDSLFGGNDTPRKLVVPATVPPSTAPTERTDSLQATLRIPGLPELQPMRSSTAAPIASTPTYVPTEALSENPFEDLVEEPTVEDSGALVEDEIEGEIEPERKPFPFKNLLIAALAAYAALSTSVAAWGWLRTAPTTKTTTPPGAVNRH